MGELRDFADAFVREKGRGRYRLGPPAWFIWVLLGAGFWLLGVFLETGGR